MTCLVCYLAEVEETCDLNAAQSFASATRMCDGHGRELLPQVR